MNLSCRPWQNAYATVAPDDAGRWLSEHGGLSHARLSIIDLAGGHQPMVKSGSGQTFAIVYNGELYNTDELRQERYGRGIFLPDLQRHGGHTGRLYGIRP